MSYFIKELEYLNNISIREMSLRDKILFHLRHRLKMDFDSAPVRSCLHNIAKQYPRLFEDLAVDVKGQIKYCVGKHKYDYRQVLEFRDGKPFLNLRKAKPHPIKDLNTAMRYYKEKGWETIDVEIHVYKLSFETVNVDELIAFASQQTDEFKRFKRVSRSQRVGMDKVVDVVVDIMVSDKYIGIRKDTDKSNYCKSKDFDGFEYFSIVESFKNRGNNNWAYSGFHKYAQSVI